MNVTFYIDEEKHQSLIQGNVAHIPAYYKQLQQDFHIEIVVNGRVVRQLKEEAAEQLEYKAAFCNSIKRGIIIAACCNIMKGQRMEEQELLNGVITVASGVVRLAVRQQAGYSYIKP